MCHQNTEIVYLKLIRSCRVHFQLVKNQQQVQFHFNMSEVERRKLVIIGDGAVGKTTLLEVFERGEYVENPRRPTFLNSSMKRMKHPTLEGAELLLTW